MASVGESGWEAFQRGEVDEALRLLELAGRADPEDFDARCRLGQVLAHTGHLSEAIAALNEAIQLRPADAHARYALAGALERAGRRGESEEALRQARLLDQPAPAEPYSGAPDSEPPYQLAPLPPTAPDWSPPAAPADLPGWTAPPASPASQSAGHEIRAAALPSHGLLSSYAPSPNAPRGPTVVQETYTPHGPRPDYKDEANIPQTLRDFVRVLTMPDRLFRDQAGKNGLITPIVMIGVFIALMLVQLVVQGAAQGLFTLIMTIAVAPFNLAIYGAAMIGGYLIGGLILHFLGWLLGNRQDLSLSVQALVFSDVPRMLLGVCAGIIFALAVYPTLTRTLIGIEEQLMGLPPGTIASQMRASGFPASGVFGPTNGTPPTVFTTGPRPNSRAGGFGTSTSTGRIRIAPRPPTPEMVVDAGKLLWRQYGLAVIITAALYALGWFWSNILLALAIHRMQQISAFRATLVVVIYNAIPLMVMLLVAFAIHGLADSLFQAYLHSGASGGPGASS